MGEFVVDAPVARLVGIGQRAAADVAAYAQMVEFAGLCTQTSFDIARALAIGRLRKGHAQKLVQTAEAADVEVAAVLLDQSTEGMPRRELHYLGEDELASVHQGPRVNPGSLPQFAFAAQVVNTLTVAKSPRQL